MGDGIASGFRRILGRLAISTLAITVSAITSYGHRTSTSVGNAAEPVKCDDRVPENGVGCIDDIDQEAWIQREGATVATELKKGWQCQLNSGDRFWLTPGNTAEIRFYYPAPSRSTKSAKPQIYKKTFDYAGAPPDTKWVRGDGQYTDEERRLLRRQIHLGGVGKGLSSEDQGIVFPSDGETIHGRKVPFVLRQTKENPMIGLTAKVYDDGGVIRRFGLSREQLSADLADRDFASAMIDLHDVELTAGHPHVCDVTVSFLHGRSSSREVIISDAPIEPSDMSALVTCLADLKATSSDKWDELCGAFQKAIDDASRADVFVAIQNAAHNADGIKISNLPDECNVRASLIDFGREIKLPGEAIFSVLTQDPITIQ